MGITLGIAILSPLAKAAPLCSKVLKVTHSTPSLSDIEHTVESIAHYRLELDLQKRSGTLNTQSNPGLTEALYQEKYTELISAVKGTHTEKQIRKQISQNIARLQAVRGQEESTEKEVRSQEAKKLLTEKRIREMYKIPYERTERIVLSRRLLNNTAGEAMEFVPKINSLLMATEPAAQVNDNRTISLLNLNTQAQTVLWTSSESTIVTTKFSSNRKSFAMFATGKDQKGELFFYDIETATHKMIKLPDEAAYTPGDRVLSLDTSPSGTSLLVILSNSTFTNKRAFLIDTQTGEATEQIQLANFTQGERHTLFISENEFVFMEDKNGIRKLGRHNLTTHVETPILSDLFFHSMQISPDLSNLFFRTATGWGNAERGVQTLEVSHLQDAEAHFINSDNEVRGAVSIIKPLPHNGLFVRQHTSFLENELMLSSPGFKIEPTIMLKETGTPTTFADMTIDPETQRIFLHSEHINGRPIYLDIWTPQEKTPSKP